MAIVASAEGCSCCQTEAWSEGALSLHPPSVSLLPMRFTGGIHPEAGGKEPLLMQAQSRVGRTENACDSALWCALRVQGAADTKQASRGPVLECKSVTPGERDED